MRSPTTTQRSDAYHVPRGVLPLRGRRPEEGLPAAGARPRPRPWTWARLAPYAYVLPALAIVGTFVVFPIGYSFYLSLQSWDLIRPAPLFVGFDTATGGQLSFQAYLDRQENATAHIATELLEQAVAAAKPRK